MTTARFYVEPATLAEGQLYLDGANHHHLSRVLRMRTGQVLQLLDGRGGIASGSVLEISSNNTLIKVDGVYRVEEERPRLKLFQALPQGKKMDVVMQWGVELGAASVTPFACSRSRLLDHTVHKRYERWCRIALECSRVAGRPYLPWIDRAHSWIELLEELANMEVVVMADEDGGDRPGAALADLDPTEVGLVIGPEGGFSATEREDLHAAGALPVTLGETVLRTETAGMVLLAAVRCHYGLL